MEFSFAGQWKGDRIHWFVTGLQAVMLSRGHRYVEDPDEASLVINFFPREEPRPFRRRGQAVFLVSVTEFAPGEKSARQAIPEGYPLLVRSLANLLIGYHRAGDSHPDAHFITPEQGYYRVRNNGPAIPSSNASTRGSSHWPLPTRDRQHLRPDLPEELWDGDEITRVHPSGRKRLDARPPPGPLPDRGDPLGTGPETPQAALRAGWALLRKHLGTPGRDPFLDERLRGRQVEPRDIGRDILLVKDYDAERGGHGPFGPSRRRAAAGLGGRDRALDDLPGTPEVGAILHVHGWMDGIPSTEFNYPCGTYELGQAVADIVREHPDPSRAVVGLKNHGLTITGPSLDEIFDRIEGNSNAVPMS
jgi:hypothetical protein